MLKKISIKALGAFIVLSLLAGSMINAYAITASTRASDYLDVYAASAQSGINHVVGVNFEVNATDYMDLVGASRIVFQVNNSGVWTSVATYYGSTSNGMLAADNWFKVGARYYAGTAGMQYRAIVTVYAADSYGSDSRTLTTNAVTA